MYCCLIGYTPVLVCDWYILSVWQGCNWDCLFLKCLGCKDLNSSALLYKCTFCYLSENWSTCHNTIEIHSYKSSFYQIRSKHILHKPQVSSLVVSYLCFYTIYADTKGVIHTYYLYFHCFVYITLCFNIPLVKQTHKKYIKNDKPITKHIFLSSLGKTLHV